MKNLQKGFTLIELLVVVAIIGILSAIVMISLSYARHSGEDATIQANFANMRAQAELYYSTYGNYGANTVEYADVCPSTEESTSTVGLMGTANPGFLTFTSAIVERVGSENTLCVVTADGGTWAVAATLRGDTTKVACVDNTGVSKSSVTDLTSAITNGSCN